MRCELLIAVLLALMLAGCSETDPAPSTTCTPGTARDCVCPAGGNGAQTCSAAGQWGGCAPCGGPQWLDAGPGQEQGPADAAGRDQVGASDMADAAPDAPLGSSRWGQMIWGEDVWGP